MKNRKPNSHKLPESNGARPTTGRWKVSVERLFPHFIEFFVSSILRRSRIQLAQSVAFQHRVNNRVGWQAKGRLPHPGDGGRQVEQFQFGGAFENREETNGCEVEPLRFFDGVAVIR